MKPYSTMQHARICALESYLKRIIDAVDSDRMDTLDMLAINARSALECREPTEILNATYHDNYMEWHMGVFSGGA